MYLYQFLLDNISCTRSMWITKQLQHSQCWLLFLWTKKDLLVISSNYDHWLWLWTAGHFIMQYLHPNKWKTLKIGLCYYNYLLTWQNWMILSDSGFVLLSGKRCASSINVRRELDSEKRVIIAIVMCHHVHHQWLVKKVFPLSSSPFKFCLFDDFRCQI